MKYAGLKLIYKKIVGKKHWLYFALGGVVLGLSIIFAPARYENLERLKKEALTKRTQVERITKFKMLHADFNSFKEQIEKEAELARKNLPKAYDEQKFLSELDKKAQGLELLGVGFPLGKDVTNLKDEKNIKLYPALVRVKGDYFALLKFIKAIEENHLAVQNFKVKADKFGTLAASMNVVSFISP